MLKGSARSIPEVHIRDVLATIDAQQPGLIERFGGHAMAAGLTLCAANLESFSAAFEQNVAQQLRKNPPKTSINTDGELETSLLNEPFAQELKTLVPWGQACPEPRFEGEFEVINARFVGEIHLKLVLCANGESQSVDAIAFRYIEAHQEDKKVQALRMRKIHAIYRLDINEFRGRQSVQLIIEHITPLPSS